MMKFPAWLSALFCLVALAGCQRGHVDGGEELQDKQAPAQLAKIFVSDSGYYSLDEKELQSAGIQASLSEPSTLRLYANGAEQPFWVDESGKVRSLSFYARLLDNRYSSQNVYWLVQEAATPPGGDLCTALGLDGEIRQPPKPIELPEGAYPATIRVENNLLYQPQASGGDHWFGASVTAPQSLNLELVLNNLATGSGRASLRLTLWSNTESSVSPDHHLNIHVNGHSAVTEVWDGKGWHTLQANLPSEWLVEGPNQVEIQAPGDSQIAADIYHLDDFELTYPRLPVAQEDTLDFWMMGREISLSGFSGPVQVLDITDESQPLRVVKDYQANQGFRGEIGRHYLALGPSGAKKPAKIIPVSASGNFLSGADPAEYLAIGPAELLAPLQPLLDWRASQGLRVKSVPVEAIYDQFSCGIPVPEAIQAYLTDAAQNWQVKPRFLLLVGDASYDPKGYVSTSDINRLPTFLVDTVFGGETASDVGFVQLNDDPWPDLAIGRLPARSPDQVDSLVDKVLTYERAQSRSSRLLAIADGQDESFRRDAQAFLDLFPPIYARELFAPQAGVQDASRQIMEYLDQENLLVAYFGHGSVNMWGKDRLFTNEDVVRMAPGGQLPVVINLTCLTGLFTHPKVESLAETMLWQPKSGAVAVLAPSSLTLPTDQSFLSHALARSLVENPNTTLGELHLAARRQISLDTQGALDVMQTFMLFGDPALSLSTAAVP